MTRPHPWSQNKKYLILPRLAATERRRYLEDWEYRMHIARSAGVTTRLECVEEETERT